MVTSYDYTPKEKELLQIRRGAVNLSLQICGGPFMDCGDCGDYENDTRNISADDFLDQIEIWKRHLLLDK